MKKILGIVLAALMLLACLPVTALAADPAGTIYVSFEDHGDRAVAAAMLEEGETLAYPNAFGTILEKTAVPFYADETIAQVVERFISENSFFTAHTTSGETKLYGGYYLKTISFTDKNGNAVSNFGEYSNSSMSGWMAALNNCIGDGLSYYKAEDGDIVEFKYSENWGADIGADFSVNSAAINGINVDAAYGTVSPAFAAGTKAYTLTVGQDVESVKLSVSTESLMNVVTYTADGVEYKYLREIPVKDGTVITVNSKHYGYDDNWNKVLSDEDTITVTVAKPAPAAPAEEGEKAFGQKVLDFFAKIFDFFKSIFKHIGDFFAGLNVK